MLGFGTKIIKFCLNVEESKYYQTEIILEEGERIIGVENVYVTPSDQYANFRSLNFVIEKD